MSDPESNPSAPSAPIKELSGRIGKYDIVKPLGKGAMGIVYLAHDTILERDVALKVMVASIADDPELKTRFEREAKAAYDYLVSLGVAADRLKTVSYGKEVPLCQQSTEDCWARNRRDHFAVTGKARQ